MKAEINNKNKAKFFALYWGQRVAKYLENVNSLSWDVYAALESGVENRFLQLKSLPSVSDEDAKAIDLTEEDFNEEGWFDDEEFFYFWSFDAVDYLRSKGYALPWMGLTVQEMVEAGWIKLNNTL